MTLKIQVPRKLEPLRFNSPARYKAAYGGRGGAKSHFFAEQLILRCFTQRTRAVCVREVQNTIKDSVRQLLIDKISKLGLEDQFNALDTEIRGPNGSFIIFKGMQSYNADNIKSLEDFDIAWVEEAQTLSDRSLRMLRPTIRKEGSEIWFSWNPRHDTDAVDKFFRGAKPPHNSIIVPVGWQDNPWFPKVLQDEKDQDYEIDPEMAAHVWGGGYEIVSEGAYFARQIARLESQGRMGFYPYDPSLPVLTAWDIGVDDYTAIWFLQENGFKVRAIDYYEASGLGAEQIVEEALPEIIGQDHPTREQPFQYGEHFFPHDVKVREWGHGAKTRLETLIGIGLKMNNIRVGVATDPADRINATRRLLPFMYFHRNSEPGVGVNLGVSRLRKYSRRFNESLGVYVGPLKDGNDHGADALGEFAINCRISRPKPKEPEPPKLQPSQVYLPGAPETKRQSRIRV